MPPYFGSPLGEHAAVAVKRRPSAASRLHRSRELMRRGDLAQRA